MWEDSNVMTADLHCFSKALLEETEGCILVSDCILVGDCILGSFISICPYQFRHLYPTAW